MSDINALDRKEAIETFWSFLGLLTSLFFLFFLFPFLV